jgi:hypothetical protein
MTFQREDLERGFEPDECFWIANEAHMRGRAKLRSDARPAARSHPRNRSDP